MGGGCCGGMFTTVSERPSRERRELDVELDAVDCTDGLSGRWTDKEVARENEDVDVDDGVTDPSDVYGRRKDAKLGVVGGLGSGRMTEGELGMGGMLPPIFVDIAADDAACGNVGKDGGGGEEEAAGAIAVYG